jgi:hypothetical protein
MTPTDLDPAALLASAATFRTESVRIAASRLREATRSLERATASGNARSITDTTADLGAAVRQLTMAMRGGGR